MKIKIYTKCMCVCERGRKGGVRERERGNWQLHKWMQQTCTEGIHGPEKLTRESDSPGIVQET